MNATTSSPNVTIPAVVLDLQTQLLAYLTLAANYFYRLPGSSIVLRYIKSSYQDDPVRSAVELFLFLFAVRYLLAPKYSTRETGSRGKGEVKLSEEEIDELVEDWTPEPLVPPQTAFEENEMEKRPIIVGPTGPKVKLSNGRTVTNLASFNFYNLLSSEHLKDSAIQTLRTYGVGPCGPPGFYGTQDVHNRVEADIAAHLGVAACILYAQAFSTISSVIPAFSKRGDVIVADSAVGYSIRKGLQISRSTVRWFQHGDMADLERVLKKVVQEGKGRQLTRRFIVAEGISEMVGDIPDLAALVELKTKYKFRLILDETHSYGVLGAHGRGLTEYAHVDATSVDMITGSLAGALCAGGGFCAGSDEVVEHQRISAAAYTYSAALPAMLATTASETIRLLTMGGPEAIRQLRESIKVMRAQLDPRSDWVRCTSAIEGPILILVLKDEVVRQRNLDRDDQEWLFQDIVDECLTNGVMITRLKAMPVMIGSNPREDGWQPTPALKVCVTTGLSKKEIEKAGVVIRHAITKIMKRGESQMKRISDSSR
ncbi:serine palmitoyltransferase 1 [Rhizodiscina lignyota]|uniref:serine C-palmitoyltransferase n=1 Tax=Rhizodiscina lignyota TaxID=1504668 RepID=A0A9P4I764_9PEZI|nr:serine palmitoyltransferase 1 [Rhizodiscina lignyota]